MALNRVTSLEECEHHEPMFRRPRTGDGNETSAPQEGHRPSSISKSPPLLPVTHSTATRHSVGERLSFNPAAGPSWTQREEDGEWDYLEEESASIPGDGSDSDDESVNVLGGPIPRADTAFHEPAPGFGHAMGAFEVGKWKRIGEFRLFVDLHTPIV